MSNLIRKTVPRSQNYSLIIRFFILIASSLIFIGLAFDTFLLQQIDDSSERNYLQLMQSPFKTVEKALVLAPQDQWLSIVEEANESSVYPIEIASRDDVIEMSNTGLPVDINSTPEIQLLYTSSGDRLFYKHLANTDKVIFIGPIIFEKAGAEQYRFLPLFFFISIFAVVWIWMRPMIKDLDILNQTAACLSEDYRASTSQLKEIRTMPQLANVFVKMAAHLKRLINTQKELSNALSHELRTPLSRIKFALAIVERELPEESQKEIRHIYKDLDEMEDIINTLLNYAQLDNPDKAIQLKSVSANEWFLEQVEKFTQSPYKNTISVEQLAIDTTLNIDPYLMGLALSNLVYNAIRYGNTAVHIDITDRNGIIALNVEDDGNGIPEDQQENIFKAFYRMDKSRDKRTGGFGLGLSIVKRIIELHGGTVTIDKSHLGGAKFTLQWQP